MKIIAVTACPVGMAHTYMAATALKKAAEKMNVEIKVETQGAMGIKDRISEEEVREADFFIDAADVAIIEGERFEGIRTYDTSANKVIRKADKILKEAIEEMQSE
jgi:fructose-specific phosphotransferase system IIB component